jgi:radical SAM superfamily enzyme YgiQ (UPF0313 family)
MKFERPPILRPPYEARSYFLPLTSGCSNGVCTFCNYYYGRPFQIRDKADVIKEIDALELYLNSRMIVPEMPGVVYAIADTWDGRSVFLEDGDALVYPYPELKEILEHLNLKFPGLERVTCYGTAGDVLSLSIDQLKVLKSLKMSVIYLGVESGDDEILRSVAKANNTKEIVDAGRRIKEAGIACAVTVIMGLGGLEKSREHALSVARILSEIDPDAADVLTLTLVPGTPMYDSNRRGEFTLITPLQSIQELKIIVENSRFSHCLFRSIHASNYLSLKGWLPEDKERILAQLDYVLSRQDPQLLRPEYLRGL